MKSREVFTISILIIIIISVTFFMSSSNTSITGFVSTEVKKDYFDLEFNETKAFTLKGEGISNLNSLRVSGEVVNNGSVDIYLVNEKGQSILVYSNKPIRTTNTITGFAIEENCNPEAWVCSEWSGACIWDQQIRECFNQCGGVIRELKPCEIEGYGSCNNSILNYNESDVDCGGVCSPCIEGKQCEVDSDCLSGECSDSSVCYNSSKINIIGLTLVSQGGGVAITEKDVTPWEYYNQEEQQLEDEQIIKTETKVDIEKPISPKKPTNPNTKVLENVRETEAQEINELEEIVGEPTRHYEGQPLTLKPVSLEGLIPTVITEGMDESELAKNVNLMLGREKIIGDPEGDFIFENQCVDSCNLPKNEGSYRLVIEVEKGTTLKLNSITYSLSRK